MLIPTTMVQTDGVTPLVHTQFTSNVSITATSEGTAQEIVNVGSVTYDGARVYGIEFYSPAWAMNSSTQDLFLILHDGSASLGWMWAGRSASGGSFAKGAIHTVVYFTPTAGTRTYSVRGFLSATATGLIVGGAGGAGSYMPGYMRLTRYG